MTTIYEDPHFTLRFADDRIKAAAAAIFYERYVTARQHSQYIRQKKLHKEKHEGK